MCSDMYSDMLSGVATERRSGHSLRLACYRDEGTRSENSERVHLQKSTGEEEVEMSVQFTKTLTKEEQNINITKYHKYHSQQ